MASLEGRMGQLGVPGAESSTPDRACSIVTGVRLQGSGHRYLPTVVWRVEGDCVGKGSERGGEAKKINTTYLMLGWPNRHAQFGFSNLTLLHSQVEERADSLT